MSTVQAPPRQADVPAQALDAAVHDVLRHPSGTTLRALLLVSTVALSAAFAGDWMYLSVAPDLEVRPPWEWMLLPPLLVLAVSLAATWLAPGWLEHRNRWRPVPADRAQAALARFEALVTEAGLRPAPTLVWDPREERDRALSYGRPGSYRVAVSPTLVAAARRRPAHFDAVVRHELAHVRHRDVATAYFAIIVWYVLLAALSAPLLWRAVDHDLSLVPEYLVRMGILALTVYWVRADLLRVRERYADLRSSQTAPQREALIAALAPSSTTAARSRRFALHPAAGARIAAIEDPRRLGRLDPRELFAVGLTAAWGAPLLAEMLVSAGASSLGAARAAQTVLLALVGAYSGAALVRWAGCLGVDRRSHPAQAAGGLLLGLGLGSAVSIGSTGLLVHASAETAAAMLSATVVAAYFLWAADHVQGSPGSWRSRGHEGRRSRVVATVAAGVFGLVAGAVLPVSELVRLHAADLLVRVPVSALVHGSSATLLAVVAPLLGVTAVLGAGAGRWRLARTVLVVGVALGVAGALTVLAVRLRVDLTGSADRTWRYYLAAVWITMGAATLAAALVATARGVGRLASSLAAAGISVVCAGAGFVLFEDVGFASTLGVRDAVGFMLDAGRPALLVAPLVAALVWLVSAPLARLPLRKGIRPAMASVVVLAVVALTVALAPATVRGHAGEPPVPATVTAAARAELRNFLANDVASTLRRRDTAYADFTRALSSPPALAAQQIQESVLVSYDGMLADVDAARTAYAPARRVQRDLDSMLRAERHLIRTQVGMMEGRAAPGDFTIAARQADRAVLTWVATYTAALDEAQKAP